MKQEGNSRFSMVDAKWESQKMNVRLASTADLSEIIEMYQELIAEMYKNGIDIWDEVYPCDYFEQDIEKKQLYVLCDNNVIVSAFALCNTNIGEKCVEWESKKNNVLYLDRLGVNVQYLGKGIGSLMIDKAKEISKGLGAEYLRLFVVDINIPAIQLYRKKGFSQAEGIFEEIIDENLVLHEYGFEIRL